MQLEVGKKYRTRDGKTIVVIESISNEMWPIRATVLQSTSLFNVCDSRLFRSGGFYIADHETHPKDLVEEVTD